MISYDDFSKCELRVARVRVAERVAGSEKLLRLEVDAGDKNDAGETILRQIVSGIGKAYEPESLIGREIVIIANLEPRKLMGLESNGMLLAASDGAPVLLQPDREVPPGSTIK